MALLNGIVTILAMVTFGGIVWWAFSKKRAKDNEEASMLPFDLPEESEERPNEKKEGRNE